MNPFQFHTDESSDQEEYNTFREEIVFSLSNEELIDIATKIIDKKKHFNFGLLNEIFISKVLLETGFIDECMGLALAAGYMLDQFHGPHCRPLELLAEQR